MPGSPPLQVLSALLQLLVGRPQVCIGGSEGPLSLQLREFSGREQAGRERLSLSFFFDPAMVLPVPSLSEHFYVGLALAVNGRLLGPRKASRLQPAALVPGFESLPSPPLPASAPDRVLGKLH